MYNFQLVFKFLVVRKSFSYIKSQLYTLVGHAQGEPPMILPLGVPAFV